MHAHPVLQEGQVSRESLTLFDGDFQLLVKPALPFVIWRVLGEEERRSSTVHAGEGTARPSPLRDDGLEPVAIVPVGALHLFDIGIR
jgi:hypothetical protein